MEYFLEYNEFHLLKNYILKDPICDWFEIQKYRGNNTYIKDKPSFYKNFILRESQKYKNNLFQKIKELSDLSYIPNETNMNETKGKILDNFPLILQGKLLDKNNIYVNCDIIIHYHLFRKLFPLINNIPFHLLCRKDDYLLINVSYSTLHFKMDLKDVSNDDTILYKKCSLYAFRDALHDIVGQRFHSFLLGKEYYYKKTLLPKKEFICHISFDKNIIDTFYSALKWINTIKEEDNLMSISPKPSHFELFPNMNYRDSDWEVEKMKVANEIKEITLVWNISYDERCNFLDKGIYCWDDPKLLKELKNTKKKHIQERMIHMNQQNDVLIYPRKNVSHSFFSILDKTEYDIYFDVESFLSIDEKQNLFTNYTSIKEPILGILGLIHQDRFFDFTIYKFSLDDEEKIVKAFVDRLWRIGKGLHKINIYHWGHAEFNYIQYIKKTYPLYKFPDYELINVLDYFRMEPIIVQGVFKFSLKSIGKALYRNKLIRTTWEENDNGLDSMIQFKEICKSHNKKIPLKRYIEIEDIIKYNRIDCQVLYEIVDLLRSRYRG